MKKIKNYNVNFTSLRSIGALKTLVADAKDKKITAICASVNTSKQEDIKKFIDASKKYKDSLGVSTIIGIEYFTNSAKFIVFGDKAVDYLVCRSHSESSLMEAKAMFDCAVILDSVNEVDMDSLNCSFNIQLLDAYIKYRDDQDELRDHDTFILKQNLLWDSVPLAGSKNNEDSYSVIKKQLNTSKDLVSYILERRPISLFSKLMLPLDKNL